MNLLKLGVVRFNTNLDPYTLGQREYAFRVHLFKEHAKTSA